MSLGPTLLFLGSHCVTGGGTAPVTCARKVTLSLDHDGISGKRTYPLLRGSMRSIATIFQFYAYRRWDHNLTEEKL